MKFTQRKGKNITGLTQMGWVVVIVCLIGSMAAYNAGLFGGTPIESLYDSVLDVETDIMVGANDVYFKVAVREDLGAFAAEDVIVNAYNEAGVWQGTATASSGLATFASFSVKEGSYIWLQVRPAAPASTDGYITPLQEFRVGNADPTDTVSAYSVETGQSILWVRDIHASTEPIFIISDSQGNDMATAFTDDNISTADTFVRLMVSVNDDDTGYGGYDFVDMVSGDEYKGGIWFVWRGTESVDFAQGSARELISWSDPTYVYYAWNFYEQLWQDSLRSDDHNSFSAVLGLGGSSTFATAQTLQLDLFDLMKVGGTLSINSFIDCGALAPAAFAAYVD